MRLCVITARVFACNGVRPSELVASENRRQHSTKPVLITARAHAQGTASRQTVAASHRGIIEFAYSISGRGHFLPLTLLFSDCEKQTTARNEEGIRARNYQELAGASRPTNTKGQHFVGGGYFLETGFSNVQMYC